MEVIQKPSPNFGVGRLNYKIEAIVIHIMDGTLQGTDSWFATPASQVSSHYGIGLNGEVHQYVKEENTAWHAGRVSSPTWSLYKPGVNPNSYTIGIEHEGKADTIWTDAMKKSSSCLIRDLCKRYNIPIDREHIVGHYQIFSQKPNCPGINKNIINELILLAKDGKPTLQDALAKLEEGITMLKSII
jgi:N-acetylmuramoyl-L-alanine amidase